MNPGLEQLHDYPFQRLQEALRQVQPAADRPLIKLTAGEPQHSPPEAVIEVLQAAKQGWGRYPRMQGEPFLRQAIAAWLRQRFQLSLAMDTLAEQHILPVNGTREALFAVAQCMLTPGPESGVFMPNPCYQIYEGAALLAGCQPHYLPQNSHTLLPDFAAVSAADWQCCQMLYLCTPDNPTGSILSQAVLQMLIRKADEYDFILVSDECYSELYQDDQRPPPGLLQAAEAMGRRAYERCLVMHSLSKRSNLPGMRSGFVAGDAGLIANFLRYRTYHGCAMPLPIQQASAQAWSDELHVQKNRNRYRHKFAQAESVLAPVMDMAVPDAGFYLWLKVPGDDVALAQDLYAAEHVMVLPGRFLSRSAADGCNPGQGRWRVALVADEADCAEAMQRIARFIGKID